MFNFTVTCVIFIPLSFNCFPAACKTLQDNTQETRFWSLWLFFGYINRCVVSIRSAGSKTECASWGWGGLLEVCHQRPDVWWGRWWGVWMDCATSVLSQPGAHQALCHTAVEIRSEVQGNAPQTFAKWTKLTWPVTYSSKALEDFGLHICTIYIYIYIVQKF